MLQNRSLVVRGRRPRGGPSLVPFALAVSLGFGATAANAGPRTWSGGAGAALPFWDLTGNWLEGLPLDGDAAALGSFATTLRSGAWALASVTGSNTLTVTGGSLALSTASTMGTLALAGGKVGGPGTLTVGSLNWSGGNLGLATAVGGITSVTGATTLAAPGHVVEFGNQLRLGGDTTLAGNGQLFISGAGVSNAIPYAASSVSLAVGKNFVIDGQVAPSLQIYGGGSFINAGTVTKATGSSVLFFDSGLDNGAGIVNVNAGELQFRNTRSLDGKVNVANGATLRFNGGTMLAPTLNISNAGSVIFAGTYNVLATGTVNIGGSVTLDSGALGGAGTMVLSGLTWSGGSMGSSLSLGGVTTVNGATSLNQVSHSIGFGHALQLNGDTSWSGNGQLFIEGAGNFNGTPYASSVVSLAAGKTLSLQGGPQSYEITGSGSFNNAGAVVKSSGNGTLFLDGAFNNAGLLRAQAGGIQVRGTLNNTGEIHANGARIEITQAAGLSQWNAASQTLTGGTYRVTGGQPIAMNLGFAPGTAAPLLIRTNQANLLLEGPGAAIVVTTTTPQANALSALSSNRGLLSLTSGAELSTTGPLAHESGGSLVIGAGSKLTVGGAFSQTGANGRTFVAGQMLASSLSFATGVFSAGAASQAIGTATLEATQLSFGSGAVFQQDLQGSSWDQVLVRGATVSLNGTLSASFGVAPLPGLYRVLTTDGGGVSGTFASVLSNLNPSAFAASAIYGVNYVDLSVSAVREPESYALLLLGMVLVGLRTLKSQESGRLK